MSKHRKPDLVYPVSVLKTHRLYAELSRSEEKLRQIHWWLVLCAQKWVAIVGDAAELALFKRPEVK